MVRNIVATCVLMLVLLGTPGWASAQFPDHQPDHPPPAGYTGPLFELEDAYPQSQPPDDPRPWDSIDFHTDPQAYLQAVLDFAIAETTTPTGIRGSDQPWFHAPWLTIDYCAGREFAHGLTSERFARPGDLATTQTQGANNWAVGLYDPRAGWTLGRVWPDVNGPPLPQNAQFPRGSTAIKFLFTTASDAQVPFLEGSLDIEASIFPGACSEANHSQRQLTHVRLLQVDVAVRDDRAAETGWVFGTFVYSAAAAPNDSTPWQHLVPVTAVWGSDETVTSRMHDPGAVLNPDLQQGWVNPALAQPSGDPRAAYVTHFGLGGRGNGPVDNPVSSCISCHARAATSDVSPQTGLRMAPSWPCDENPQTARPTCGPPAYPEDAFPEYFRSVAAGIQPTAAVARLHHLDYSLQLAVGFDQWCDDGHEDEPVCDPQDPPAPPNALALAAAPSIVGVGPESPSRGEPIELEDSADAPPVAAAQDDTAEDASPLAGALPPNTAPAVENELLLPVGVGVGVVVLLGVIAFAVRRRR